MRNHLTFLLGLGATLLLESCHDAPEPTATLFDTRWTLEQVENFPVTLSSNMEDYSSYLQFAKAGNKTLGRAACYDFSTTYVLTTGSQQLAIAAPTLAPASCAGSLLAARYLAALPLITRYEVQDHTLRLYDAPGKALLIFQAAP